MGAISVTTHIKTIFSFWTGTGKHCRSQWPSGLSTVFGRSNTGSNPARGMDVCLRLSVLCFAV
jgi:hypothetical protein